MRGDSHHVDLTGSQFDEEQDVDLFEEYGVDGEEVTGQDRLCLGGQELLLAVLSLTALASRPSCSPGRSSEWVCPVALAPARRSAEFPNDLFRMPWAVWCDGGCLEAGIRQFVLRIGS
jgi:hypothetical protein